MLIFLMILILSRVVLCASIYNNSDIINSRNINSLEEFNVAIASITSIYDELNEIYGQYELLRENPKGYITKLFKKQNEYLIYLYEFVAKSENEYNAFLIFVLEYKLLCLYFYKKLFLCDGTLEELAGIYGTKHVVDAIDHTLIARNSLIDDFFFQGLADLIVSQYPKSFFAKLLHMNFSINSSRPGYYHLHICKNLLRLILSVSNKKIVYQNKDLLRRTMLLVNTQNMFFQNIKIILLNIKHHIPVEMHKLLKVIDQDLYELLKNCNKYNKITIVDRTNVILQNLGLEPSPHINNLFLQCRSIQNEQQYLNISYMKMFVSCADKQSKMLKYMVFPKVNQDLKALPKNLKTLISKLRIKHYPRIIFYEDLLLYYAESKNFVFLRDFLLKILPQFSEDWKNASNPEVKLQVLKAAFYIIQIFNEIKTNPNYEQIFEEIMKELKMLTKK